MTKLSVIIPTYNRRLVLERTFPSLLAQDLSPHEYEIIVVMDGSSDGTEELLRGLKSECVLRALETPAARTGAGAARNIGLHAARGNLVLFLDDDLVAAPDLFRQHCEAHLCDEPMVVFGPIYVAPDSPDTLMRYVTEQNDEAWYRNLNPELNLRYPEAVPSSLTITVLSFLVNASVSRELLLAVRGFDESFRAAEDRDLGVRLWKKGIRFCYRPTAMAREFYVKSARQHLECQASAIDGDLRMSRKHPEHRPYSVLANLSETGRVKKALRKVLACFPLSPVPLLALPLRAERELCRSIFLRRIGIRTLQVAERIAGLRAAVNSAGSWKALEDEFGHSLPVLMYHHVGPLRSDIERYLTVTPEQFERQIRWLAAHGYVGIRPSDWLRWRKDGIGLPARPILLTFDDAYADLAEYALPVLQRYGFGAAVFVVTGQIGGTNAWDESRGCGRFQLMNADQIRSWADQGIEFGAHSRTHPDLTTLTPAECAKEMIESKNELASLLGSPVGSFAYPYGKYNESVRDIAESNFDLAFSADEGMNYLRGDPHLLRRAYVGSNDSMIEFALIVRWGSFTRFRALRARFGVRSRLKRAGNSVFQTLRRRFAGG
jgi:peptidoglycan/xylan/chitin deacetylase (PgdA/CDA1 family)/glycosyltransferase involved in cell wall biosynthesis